MRRIVILPLVGLASAAAFAAQPASLQLFAADFQPGEYSVTAVDADSLSRSDGPAKRCIIAWESLLHVGLDAADGKNCVHTVVEDTADRATVAYSCRGLGSGRTTIVKDNGNHYTIDAQGIRGREPFAMRQEFKRVGNCG